MARRTGLLRLRRQSSLLRAAQAVHAAVMLAGSACSAVDVAVGDLGAAGGGELAECAQQLPACIDALVAGQGRSPESLAFGVLNGWLAALHSGGSDGAAPRLGADATLRAGALRHLMNLGALATSARPELALAVAGALLGYFWWGGTVGGARSSADEALGPDPGIAAAAFSMQEIAVHYASCADSHTSTDAFLRRQCPHRWRTLLFVGAELGRRLLRGPVADVAGAAAALRRVAGQLQLVRVLPHFAGHDTVHPLRLNMNRDYFPVDVQQQSLWPRGEWPDFAHFLEANAAVFREDLAELLAVDPGGDLFRAVARQQADQLARREEDWSRLDLVNGAGPSEWCKMLPQLRRSCSLLAVRPEINERCTTYLAGAAIARLLPGAELRPHFDTHARLAAHVGLLTSRGAIMTVGGERVTWEDGQVVVFDDTYVHSVFHDGADARYVLITWFCHPCDEAWRHSLGTPWLEANPLPAWCGAAGGGRAPVANYGEGF